MNTRVRTFSKQIDTYHSISFNIVNQVYKTLISGVLFGEIEIEGYYYLVIDHIYFHAKSKRIFDKNEAVELFQKIEEQSDFEVDGENLMMTSMSGSELMFNTGWEIDFKNKKAKKKK